jgi:hypothetical protein
MADADPVYDDHGDTAGPAGLGSVWERSEQIDADAIRVVHHGVAVAPKRVPWYVSAVVTGRGQLV